MTEPLPCPRCGLVPKVTEHGLGYVVCCDDCYDGTIDDPGRHEIGSGLSPKDAVSHWREITLDVRDEITGKFVKEALAILEESKFQDAELMELGRRVASWQ